MFSSFSLGRVVRLTNKRRKHSYVQEMSSYTRHIIMQITQVSSFVKPEV